MARKTHEEFIRELKKGLGREKQKKTEARELQDIQEELERKFAALFGDSDGDG